MPSPPKTRDKGAKSAANDIATNANFKNNNVRYEIPSDPTPNGFVIIRQPARNFNVSKGNRLAQRDLRQAGVEYRDWSVVTDQEESGEKPKVVLALR